MLGHRLKEKNVSSPHVVPNKDPKLLPCSFQWSVNMVTSVISKIIVSREQFHLTKVCYHIFDIVHHQKGFSNREHNEIDIKVNTQHGSQWILKLSFNILMENCVTKEISIVQMQVPLCVILSDNKCRFHFHPIGTESIVTDLQPLCGYVR